MTQQQARCPGCKGMVWMETGYGESGESGMILRIGNVSDGVVLFEMGDVKGMDDLHATCVRCGESVEGILTL